MTRPFGTIDIDAVIEDVVDQFGDPYAFVRELVQNSIDAGTGRIEVEFEYDRSTFGDGSDRGVVHVRDWGEGMDRQIIEEEFLRLFRSDKADDLTKIGRFGIGFVSVFAIEPDVVCVDTGRSGEYWRVLFDEVPSYELLELDRPIEGTHVRIFKEASPSEFSDMKNRTRSALEEWCRHASVPILVDGRDIREPFEIESACTASHRETGTRIEAGVVPARRAAYGYYNSGLTLEEGRGGKWPNVAYKIDSRYLEHTVARDGVVEDEHFHKAEERLEEMVREELPAKLIAKLEQTARQMTERAEFDAQYDVLARSLASFLEPYGAPVEGWEERSIVPTTAGEVATIEECRNAAESEELYVVESESFPRGVGAELLAVPVSGPKSGTFRLLEVVLGRAPPRFHESFARLEPVAEEERSAARKLSAAVASLLADLSCEAASVECARVRGPDSVSKDVAVVLEKSRTDPAADALPSLDLEAISGRHLYLNVGHRTVDTILEVAAREPIWAAYSLVKVLGAGELEPERDLDCLRRLVRERTGRSREEARDG